MKDKNSKKTLCCFCIYRGYHSGQLPLIFCFFVQSQSHRGVIKTPLRKYCKVSREMFSSQLYKFIQNNYLIEHLFNSGFFKPTPPKVKLPQEVFYEKGVPKNFALFTVKHLCWSLFLIKLKNICEQFFRRTSANG